MNVIKNESLNPLLGKTKGIFNDGNKYYQFYKLDKLTNNDSFEIYTNCITRVGGKYEANLLATYMNTALIVKKEKGKISLGNTATAVKTDKILSHVVVTIKDYVVKLYVDGEYGSQKILPSYYNWNTIISLLTQSYNACADGNLYLFRRFNYVLSEQEIKNLYNNGRPDKFVLGNEFKNININFNYNISEFTGKEYIVDDNNFTKWEEDVVHIKSDGTYTLLGSSIVLKKGHQYTVTTNAKGNGYVTFSGAYDNGIKINSTDYKIYTHTFTQKEVTANFVIKRINAVDAYIKEVTIKEAGCIGEYLPSSITSEKWLDTSGQDNHLIPQGTPELIYQEPYQDIIVGEDSPSLTPDFIGQKYIDTKNKKKYKAFGTSAISDWIALN